MNRRHLFLRIPFLVSLLFFALRVQAAASSVEFPGPPPGKGTVTQKGSVLTLSNGVLAASWSEADGRLRPVAVTNRLTGVTLRQPGTELFRLATSAPERRGDAGGVWLTVRLEAKRVVALASPDRVTWTELASFPRAAFPGEPTLVRFGKMDLHAQAKDYAGDAGAAGEGVIDGIAPALPAIPGGRFAFTAKANQASAAESPFPAGAKAITCRIDKRTDQGMSWGPALALIWEDGKKYLLVGVRDKTAPTFNVTTAAGEQIRAVVLDSAARYDLPSSTFRLAAPPKRTRLVPTAGAGGGPASERFGGAAIDADLVSDRGVRAHWHAEMRDGSNYIHQTLALAAPARTVPLYGVEMTDILVPGAATIGSVPGCPVAGSGLFLGVEMPGAQNTLTENRVRIGFDCRLELSPAQGYAFGAVVGIAPAGQLRRAFLCYLERERARPATPFLHYNDWYDLGPNVTEASLMASVTQFDAELVKNRGVPVQSYLIDDGWDSPDQSFWQEDREKFPDGFRGVREKFARLGTHMSVWISPLGGYGTQPQRTEQARKLGLIPPQAELDFVYPAYKRWFQNRCLQMMREDGANAFKWDKAGEGVGPHFMALLDIARHLRQQDPSLFINVTVGTWPSPFWLNHIDSTWRTGSADVGWAGVGDDREKWLTYRDGMCHQLFVEQSPLYPLNSIMHHGIVHGRLFQGERVGRMGAHLRNEARSYFANGTMLQELYLSPSLMTPDAWDRVAEAAKWAHANADVLVDSHWVGGDPLRGQPYGYAAWNRRKGTLMVRNPSDHRQSIPLDAGPVFELPANAARRYTLRSPYADQRVQTLILEAGRPTTVTLQPFEVLVFDATPR